MKSLAVLEFPAFSSTPAILRYPPTPYQVELCKILMPPNDEIESRTHQSYIGPPFILTTCHKLNIDVNANTLQAVMKKIAKEYPVFSTQFYRNERILDADLECHLHKFTPSVEFADYNPPSDYSIYKDTILLESQRWRSKINLRNPLGALVLNPVDEPGASFVVIACSALIIDSVGLSWLTNEIFRMYSVLQGVSLDRLPSLLVCQQSVEKEPFHEITQEYRMHANDPKFWKDQFIEETKDFIGKSEKKSLQTELQKLTSEKMAIKISLETVTKRELVLKNEIESLRKHRREMDDETNDPSQNYTYFDNETGKVMKISQVVRNVLIRTVLGVEATCDNVIPLLDKHEISKDVQRKINAQDLTLEVFANLEDANVENVGLLTRDRKKIMALAEYVRNRLRESVHEQAKVKFTLERKIAKTARDLKSASESLKEMQKSLETVDDMSIRLGYVLNPPIIEKITDPITLQPEYDIFASQIGPVSHQYEFQRFEISRDVVENLARFRSNWAANIRNRKSQNHEEWSDHDSLLGSASEPEDFDAGETSHWSGSRSLNVVCLAAFSVLMRHISGMEKFLIGITYSFRYPGSVVGPLSDTLPIKLDLSQKSLTFDALFADLFKIFHHIKIHGKSCPSPFIARTLEMPADPPVRFEFITNAQRQEWERLGFKLDDIFYENQTNCKEFAKLVSHRVWAINEQDDYDLKFIIIENGSALEAGIRYRSDRFSSEKIEKWTQKYLSTLDLIDPARKIKLTSLISKYLTVDLDITIQHGRAATLWAHPCPCTIRSVAACKI